MMNLFITRHGETIWNRQGRLQGWQNSPLTEKGVRQGQLLEKALTMYRITRIYTSPSPRALETAQHAQGASGIPIHVLEELKEMNMGDWEGRTLEDIKAKEPENFKDYWSRPHRFKKNSGESFEEVLVRTRRALERMVAESGEENVLVVTHGVTLKALLSHFSDLGFEEFWTRPVVEQGSISHVELREDFTGIIRSYGDTAHMKGDTL